MPRTSPTVNGTPTYNLLSIRLIDYTGDRRSVSLVIPTGTTDASIEALIALVGDHTHASIYAVERSLVYSGDASKSNATQGNHSSVYDNVVVLFRNNATRQTQDMFVPAPTEDLFIEGTDQPDMDLLGALFEIASATETVIGAAAYNPISARFSERREINQSEKF